MTRKVEVFWVGHVHPVCFVTLISVMVGMKIDTKNVVVREVSVQLLKLHCKGTLLAVVSKKAE